MQILESEIENKFTRAVTRAGAIVLKLNLSGNCGWPDRLVLCPDGVAIFIEFKRPGYEPTSLQYFRHGQLRALNHDVRVFDDAQKAASYVIKKMDT